MTRQEAAQRLVKELLSAKKEKLCTIQEYVLTLPLVNLAARQWAGSGMNIGEDQYQNVWNVIIQDWEKKEEAKT